MGIENFNGFIKTKAPNAILEVPLQTFSNKSIAIDMYGLIFKMRSGALKAVQNVIDFETGEVNHAEINSKCTELIINRFIQFMKLNINLILCFDSEHNELRAKVRARRNKNKKPNREKFSQCQEKLKNIDPLFRASIINEMSSLYRKMQELQDGYVGGLKDLLKTIGFIVVHPSDFYTPKTTGDGEALCSTLCMNGICASAYVSDGDFHLYGGNTSIIEMDERWEVLNGARQKVWYVTLRSLEVLLQVYGINFQQFQQACILGGIDYNDGVPGIALITAMKNIKMHGNITNFAIVNHNESSKKGKSPIDWTLINYDEVKKIIDTACIQLPQRNWNFNIENFHKYGKISLEREGLHSFYGMILYTPIIKNHSMIAL